MVQFLAGEAGCLSASTGRDIGSSALAHDLNALLSRIDINRLDDSQLKSTVFVVRRRERRQRRCACRHECRNALTCNLPLAVLHAVPPGAEVPARETGQRPVIVPKSTHSKAMSPLSPRLPRILGAVPYIDRAASVYLGGLAGTAVEKFVAFGNHCR